MVFCNINLQLIYIIIEISHNPYFNRWFSAIIKTHYRDNMGTCHNPYFNRWFSAISSWCRWIYKRKCHNPYFNRWFSAIKKKIKLLKGITFVTILILIDGFLQSQRNQEVAKRFWMSQSLF